MSKSAVVAKRLDAIEIWTDVDGVMTADPRYVKEARSIEQLSDMDIPAELNKILLLEKNRLKYPMIILRSEPG